MNTIDMNKQIGHYALNFDGEKLEHVGDIVLNLNYWDCECKGDFIHSINQQNCNRCGSLQEESPSSIETEVQRLLKSKKTGFF